MKCLCGYEYETVKDYHGLNIIVGDEPFKEIEISSPSAYSSLIIRGRGQVSLFACPKCSTVKVNI